MSNSPQKLTRNQLAEFLPNARAVRAFEQVLNQVGNLLPSDIATLNRLIQEAVIDASTADSKAQSALDLLGMVVDGALVNSAADNSKSVQTLDALARIAQLLEFATLTPRQEISFSDIAGVSIKTPVAGNLQIFNATLQQWGNALLTPGANVTITNSDGAITIAVSGAPPTGLAGGVLNGSYPNPGFAARPSFSSTIGVGAVSASASGSGVSFPATQSASTDPNTLDDYEEGSCSMTVSSSVGSITTASVSATYTKIGRVVLVTGTVSVANNGTGSGALLMSGLPFTPSGNACGVGREANTSGWTCSFMVSNGSTQAQIFNYANLYPVVTGSAILFSISYTTS